MLFCDNAGIRFSDNYLPYNLCSVFLIVGATSWRWVPSKDCDYLWTTRNFTNLCVFSMPIFKSKNKLDEAKSIIASYLSCQCSLCYPVRYWVSQLSRLKNTKEMQDYEVIYQNYFVSTTWVLISFGLQVKNKWKQTKQPKKERRPIKTLQPTSILWKWFCK